MLYKFLYKSYISKKNAKILRVYLFKKIYIINKQRRRKMVEKLKIKDIYEDFIKNVKLTEEQKKILDMLINKETIVKISMEIGVSERTISNEIKKLKDLYNDYVYLQTWKALLLI